MTSYTNNPELHFVPALLSAMPGWQLRKDPVGFGWAPSRHLRAELSNDASTMKVVIRQCWNEADLQVQEYLYRNVLKDFPFKTPELITTFMDNNENAWMVLEDVGHRIVTT